MTTATPPVCPDMFTTPEGAEWSCTLVPGHDGLHDEPRGSWPTAHSHSATVAGWAIVNEGELCEFFDVGTLTAEPSAELYRFAVTRSNGLNREAGYGLWRVVAKLTCGHFAHDLTDPADLTIERIAAVTAPVVAEVSAEWELENMGGGINRPALWVGKDQLVYSDDSAALYLTHDAAESVAEWDNEYPVANLAELAEQVRLIVGVSGRAQGLI